MPFQPVDNLDLDRIYRVDARLSKKLPFTERVTGYLQFEAFNVFNTPSLGQPSNTGIGGNAGQITGTRSQPAHAPDSRFIQLSMKYSF